MNKVKVTIEGLQPMIVASIREAKNITANEGLCEFTAQCKIKGKLYTETFIRVGNKWKETINPPIDKWEAMGWRIYQY